MLYIEPNLLSLSAASKEFPLVQFAWGDELVSVWRLLVLSGVATAMSKLPVVRRRLTTLAVRKDVINSAVIEGSR